MNNSVGEPDPHHEVRKRLAFAAGSTDRSDAIALRVDTPPPEIGLDPFIGNRAVTVVRKIANLLKALPRVLDRLEPLRPLCLGFFRFCLCAHFPSSLLSSSGKAKGPSLFLAMGPFPKLMIAF